MLLLSAILFVVAGALFTYSLYKFADHELLRQHKKRINRRNYEIKNLN